MKRHTAMLAALAAIALLALQPGARAADLDIKAFYGQFRGGGVAEDAGSVYFGVTARDFDVDIGPADDGFRLRWTSVIRGGGDPDKPNVRRKTATMVFTRTDRPGIWRGESSGDPVTGGEAAWARIRENTLSVYLMVVRDDGAYEIQEYDRTLTGSGMELVFTRLRDGDEIRSVKGRLVKVAK